MNANMNKVQTAKNKSNKFVFVILDNSFPHFINQ